MPTLGLAPLAFLAALAVLAGCGSSGDAGDDRSGPGSDAPPEAAATRESRGGPALEPFVSDPAGVRACLIRKDHDLQGYPGLDVAQWWELATKSLVAEELPEPEIEAWEWQEAFVGFYASPEAAAAAERQVRGATRDLGMPMARFGNVLRVDDEPSEPAAIGALEACLGDAAHPAS